MRLAFLIRRLLAATLIFSITACTLSESNAVSVSVPGPPNSWASPSKDGTHLLVMLSAVPRTEDRGVWYELPSGQHVNLRDRFPISGLYEIESTSPQWTVNWTEDQDNLKISHDGRYLVRINEYGAGTFDLGRSTTHLSWAIKFYDEGREIKNYDVRELVDFPSLMPLQSFDSHLVWYGNWSMCESHDGGFADLRTSTRDTFRFDLATGEIVSEARFWRHISRGAIVALLLTVSGIAFYAIRRRKVSKRIEAVPITPLVEVRPTYSLRTLLLSVTAAATFLGVFRFWPHIAVWVSALGSCAFLTVFLFRSRRRFPWNLLSKGAKQRRIALWTATSIAGVCGYVLSFPPALIASGFLPHDFHMAFMQIFYAPVFYLLFNTSLWHWPLVRAYVECWSQ